jgi:hypothetical protein
MRINAIEKCRICGSKDLELVIDLGKQMLASVIVTSINKKLYPKDLVPLEVVRCNTEVNRDNCGLVQLKHSYPHENIYREYWYRSGVNQTMREALKNVVENADRFVNLKPGDVIVDIGCNDGTLLSNYDEKLFSCIGFDPAENIRGENEKFKRVIDFYKASSFKRICPNKKASVITSIAMFYDLDDPNSFVADIASCLDKDGIWIVQMADLPEMLKGNMFDQIIHEHLEYYHISPFKYLLEKHGLKIVDIEKNDINGSSYRFYVKHSNGEDSSNQKRIDAYINEEKNLYLNTDRPYERFRKGSEMIRDDLRAFVNKVNFENKTVIAYGGSTKGNIILQYCKFTKEDIPFVADRNPRKYGGWTVGSGIPIISEEEARAMKPDYFLVLPYYFLSEMINREREFLEQGGKFIVPIPKVHTVDRSALSNYI